MENKLTGKLKEKMETQTFSSGFAKREFVVTTDETYPQDIKLEFVKDKCELLEQHEIGDGVMVSFNLRGNEYNGKYYVNLQAWKIEVASLVAALPAEEPADDLPF